MKEINYEIGEIIPYQQTNCLQLVECATCTGCIFDHGQCERPNFLPTCTPNKNIYKQVTDPQILDYRKYRRIYYDISNTDSYDEIIQNLIKLGGTISETGIKQDFGYYYINAYGIISYNTERPEKYVRYTLSDDINNMPNPEFVKNYCCKINPEKEVSTQTNKITDLKLKSMSDLKQNQEGTAQKQSMFKIMFDKMKTQFEEETGVKP